mgnify:CR=1 FL=1
MIDNNYFLESIPDGISNAINDYDESIDCCNQDSYDILLKSFGDSLNPNTLKNINDSDLLKFSNNVKIYFELSNAPSISESEKIITTALAQWGG